MHRVYPVIWTPCSSEPETFSAQLLLATAVEGTVCLSTNISFLPCLSSHPQLKHGEIHSTVHAAAVLTDTQYALEVQMSAYGILQLLVSNSSAVTYLPT